GGKFRLRFASAVGGSQNLEVDVSYVARVPVLGTVRMPTRFPQDDPVEVTTLPLLELAAGKFTALMQRTVARDAFDAANLLQSMPDLLEDAEFRLAFVCSMAGGRHDPREMQPMDPAPSELDIRQQLLPVLQQSEDAPGTDPEELRTHLHRCLQGVATKLFDWSSEEIAFLDRLHDEGKVDASILHSDPQVQQRIQTQPMLLWKAQNVRRHRKGAS
ncbi:MAG: nucleotidyl transferase AbiEii/AbiGii toxin family protein, partial [Acidobacteriota bacterium]